MSALLVLDSNKYFQNVVEEAFQERRLDTYPHVKSYLVEVLKHYLLVENLYCNVAKSLGMCYTLHMTKENKFKMVTASDKMGNDVVLVLVDDTYVLNYWPNTVETNVIQDFSIKSEIDIRKQLERLT